MHRVFLKTYKKLEPPTPTQSTLSHLYHSTVFIMSVIFLEILAQEIKIVNNCIVHFENIQKPFQTVQFFNR